MLVLTRRAGESIIIGDEIELKVLKIRGNQVHLGIEAPKDAAVHRREVWMRIHGEPQAADRHSTPMELPRSTSPTDPALVDGTRT